MAQAKPLSRPLAVVTGASSGIGYELARLCAENGFDLVIAADRPRSARLPRISGARRRRRGGRGRPCHARGRRPAPRRRQGAPGRGAACQCRARPGRRFLDQDFGDARHVIDTNITGTLHLVQHVGREMRARGEGRILIVGSVAGFIPGSFQAVYNGTKAFIDSFSWRCATS